MDEREVSIKRNLILFLVLKEIVSVGAGGGKKSKRKQKLLIFAASKGQEI